MAGAGVPAAMMRVAILDDVPVVVAGLRGLLAPHDDRVTVVECRTAVSVPADVEVVLYDPTGPGRAPLAEAVAKAPAPVLVYAWDVTTRLVRDSLGDGATGCVTKALDAVDLVIAIEKAAGGSVVLNPDPCPGADLTAGGWPGREHGLSPREAEVLGMIAQGRSNQEIAETAHVTVNSVRTYIRSAYAKVGVQRRTQAVLWATAHGLVP